MSMFDNIVFDEFTLLEGEQAEAYKEKKDNEKRKEKHEEIERIKRRSEAGRKGSKNSNINYDDNIRNDKSSLIANQMMKNTKRRYYDDYVNAKDAANRHMRRHAKHECTFDTNYLFESGIEII